MYIQSHNDALDDHRRIRMDEYKRDYRKLETRYCDKHTGDVYILSCDKCYDVFCAGSVPEIDMCTDGEFFNFMLVRLVTIEEYSLLQY